ncbi:MAG: type II toxin-antitoxin system VapC family toxin [Chloroflexi bacterium]|nr:type II toxin-antitoxin system VapC family toxin [Chloroflexota bacterium]
MAALAFAEERAPEAEALLAGQELYEPQLLSFELASVARKKILRDPDSTAGILAALGTVMRMAIQWSDVPVVPTVELAISSGLTSYDATYLYLARQLRLPLLMFDERLRSAM